jgi:hypothetical protein
VSDSDVSSEDYNTLPKKDILVSTCDPIILALIEDYWDLRA